MATTTRDGAQIGYGTVIKKTGFTNGDVEVSQKFVDDRAALRTLYSIRSDLDGTFKIEKMMRGSGTWMTITQKSHAGSASAMTEYLIDDYCLGLSRITFTVTDAGATTTSYLEIEARSLPRT